MAGSGTAAAISVSDVAFDVQMKLVTNIQGGILFGVNNSGFYFFGISQDEHLQGNYTLIYCPKNNGCQTLKVGMSGSLNGIILPSKTPWNTVGVIVRGQTFTLFVNGTQVTQVTNSQYSQGVIGVCVGIANVPPDISFRDAEIWKP